MIKSLQIQDFQSHKDTTMEFSSGLNVITGDSDAGKSSILKALLWLFRNRPTGDEFKNWNSMLKDPVAVEIETNDGLVAIVRENGKNYYVINGGEPLSAIKTDVPTEVSELLNMSDYNIQSQHDPYFLIKDSPGEVARKLNELVGMGVIDTLYKNIGSKIRGLHSDKEHLKGSISQTEADLEKYVNLPEIEKLIERIEKNHADAVAFQLSHTQILKTVSQLKEIKLKREKLAPLMNLESGVQELLDKVNKCLGLVNKSTRMKSAISLAKNIREQMAISQEWMNVEGVCQPILEKIKEVESLHISKYQLTKHIAYIRDCQKAKAEAKVTVAKLTKHIEKIGICPTCGNKLTKKGLNV